MPERDANQLAADVRAGFTFDRDIHDKIAADAALDELVARITDLEERYDVLASTVKGTAFDVVAEKVDAEIKLARAEARVTDLEAQVEYTDRALTNMTEWHNEAMARLKAAEAQVAALTQDNAVLRELPSREVVARAEAAEAEVQRLREEREGYALLAEDEAVRGEYHAEGLDERGIYGGKSHEPIEERPVDRRHPDYADDPWLAEDTPKGGAA